jgi:hypothetical protein
MTLRNFILAMKDQGPPVRFIRNLWKGHILGLFSERSHLTQNGTPKVKYNTKASATKAAAKMSQKHNTHFSNYKCLWCDGYHLGKNRENKNVR